PSLHRSPPSSLFPCTTLFRSADADLVLENDEEAADDVLDERLRAEADRQAHDARAGKDGRDVETEVAQHHQAGDDRDEGGEDVLDRKSTRLNSSHVKISYAVF